MSYSRAFPLSVVVSGNTGTGVLTFPKISGVKVRTIAIDAPAGAIYDWVLKDGEGYSLTGEVAASGDETYYLDQPIAAPGFAATGSIVFANASNGTYNIKVWCEYN